MGRLRRRRSRWGRFLLLRRRIWRGRWWRRVSIRRRIWGGPGGGGWKGGRLGCVGGRRGKMRGGGEQRLAGGGPGGSAADWDVSGEVGVNRGGGMTRIWPLSGEFWFFCVLILAWGGFFGGEVAALQAAHFAASVNRGRRSWRCAWSLCCRLF